MGAFFGKVNLLLGKGIFGNKSRQILHPFIRSVDKPNEPSSNLLKLGWNLNELRKNVEAWFVT